MALVGLVLSPVSQDGDILADQFLSGEEIASLNMRGCELTVLSACESGVGYQEEENGCFGIQRAFHLAGVQNVIASGWKVNDQATMVLMTRFYRNLFQEKMPKAEALREAQLWMLNNPKGVFDDESLADLQERGDGFSLKKPSAKRSQKNRLPPKYWAAFSLSGDWN